MSQNRPTTVTPYMQVHRDKGSSTSMVFCFYAYPGSYRKHDDFAQAGRCAGMAGALPRHPAAEEEARATAAHASAAH